MRLNHKIRTAGLLFGILLLSGTAVSCRSAAPQTEAGRERVDQTEDHSLSGNRTERNEGALAEKPGAADSGEEGPVIVDQLQLAPGYGIIREGYPALYIMDRDASRTRAEGKDVTAQLLSAVYQDNVLSAKVLIKDYSVTIIPQEEAQKLLEKERENEQRQEQGEEVEWDDSYFCLDSGKQIYGRSAFRDRLRAGTGKDASGTHFAAPDRGNTRIYGAGIPDSGYIFNSSRTERSYDSFEEGGYITGMWEGAIRDRTFDMREPEGIYQLWLEGFEEPLEITFKRAPVYESLDGMEGITEHEGFYGVCRGWADGDSLRLWTGTLSPDGYRISFRSGKLMVTYADGKTEEALSAYGGYVNPDVEHLSGIQPKSSQEAVYKIPAGGTITEAVLQAEQPVIISDEISPVIELPVPREAEALDKTIEFRDCRIHLTGIRRLEEQYDYGTDAHGNPIKKHMVAIDVRAELKDADKNLYYISGLQSREGNDSIPENPYDRTFSIMDIQGADDRNTGELVGIKAFYDEGDTAVRLQLAWPSYWWNQEFVLDAYIPE